MNWKKRIGTKNQSTLFADLTRSHSLRNHKGMTEMMSIEEISELRQAVANWEVAEGCKREERDLVLRTERLQQRLTQDVLNVM